MDVKEFDYLMGYQHGFSLDLVMYEYNNMSFETDVYVMSRDFSDRYPLFKIPGERNRPEPFVDKVPVDVHSYQSPGVSLVEELNSRLDYFASSDGKAALKFALRASEVWN